VSGQEAATGPPPVASQLCVSGTALRHAELVGEVQALVREHPLRERLRAVLMQALYGSGPQVEAFEA
jgi:DNA-binding SARP family transcriptional activator